MGLMWPYVGLQRTGWLQDRAIIVARAYQGVCSVVAQASWKWNHIFTEFKSLYSSLGTPNKSSFNYLPAG